ncbi:MAG: hypothetical protein Q7R96_06115, partial [Nanoarchaeota archaeon]|nr:hypothetical protein [Nanoarchaeota archaeon]
GVTAANAGIGRLEAAMARVNPTRSKWQTAAIGTAAALALVAAGAMARGCGAAPAVVPPLPAPPAKVDNSSQSAVNQQPQLIYVDQRTLRQGVQYTDNLHMNSGIQGGIQSLEGKKDVAPEGKSVPPVSVPVDPKVEPKDKPVQPVKDVFMPFDEPVNELCSSIRAYRGMVNGVKGYKLDLLWTDAEGDLFAIKHPLSDRTDGAFDYVIVRPTDVVGDVNNKYRVFDRGVRLEIGQKTRFVDADGVNSPEVNLEAVLMRLDGKREGKQ